MYTPSQFVLEINASQVPALPLPPLPATLEGHRTDLQPFCHRFRSLLALLRPAQWSRSPHPDGGHGSGEASPAGRRYSAEHRGGTGPGQDRGFARPGPAPLSPRPARPRSAPLSPAPLSPGPGRPRSPQPAQPGAGPASLPWALARPAPLSPLSSARVRPRSPQHSPDPGAAAASPSPWQHRHRSPTRLRPRQPRREQAGGSLSSRPSLWCRLLPGVAGTGSGGELLSGGASLWRGRGSPVARQWLRCPSRSGFSCGSTRSSASRSRARWGWGRAGPGWGAPWGPGPLPEEGHEGDRGRLLEGFVRGGRGRVPWGGREGGRGRLVAGRGGYPGRWARRRLAPWPGSSSPAVGVEGGPGRRTLVGAWGLSRPPQLWGNPLGFPDQASFFFRWDAGWQATRCHVGCRSCRLILMARGISGW